MPIAAVMLLLVCAEPLEETAVSTCTTELFWFLERKNASGPNRATFVGPSGRLANSNYANCNSRKSVHRYFHPFGGPLSKPLQGSESWK
ncbi:hypothetical protein ABEW77_11345 [Heyndrickxia sporothermodurans]